MFTLKIETTNESFGDQPEHELARILAEVASKVGSGETWGICMDENGNKVGSWMLARTKWSVLKGKRVVG